MQRGEARKDLEQFKFRFSPGSLKKETSFSIFNKGKPARLAPRVFLIPSIFDVSVTSKPSTGPIWDFDRLTMIVV